jgi:hypothetical protein
MSIQTLEPFKHSFTQQQPHGQGRSTKQLKQVTHHDGLVWVARWEGRPGKFSGSTVNKALKNLQAGDQ